MSRHTHLALGRGVGEVYQTRIIYAIERDTGSLTPISLAEFDRLERNGTLLDYYVRLDRVAAEACAAEIRAKAMSCN
jgi:hypothetical protein